MKVVRFSMRNYFLTESVEKPIDTDCAGISGKSPVKHIFTQIKANAKYCDRNEAN